LSAAAQKNFSCHRRLAPRGNWQLAAAAQQQRRSERKTKVKR